MRVALDTQGWPKGKLEVDLDIKPLGLNPDGPVIDNAGMMWLAQWGAPRVTAYGPLSKRSALMRPMVIRSSVFVILRILHSRSLQLETI